MGVVSDMVGWMLYIYVTSGVLAFYSPSHHCIVLGSQQDIKSSRAQLPEPLRLCDRPSDIPSKLTWLPETKHMDIGNLNPRK
jgi:hypothetical protein